MGFVREVQPESSKPSHCERRVGQTCQGTHYILSAGGLQGKKDLCQMMLCTLQVFATSESSGYETNNHQCTDDNNEKKTLLAKGKSRNK